MVALAEARRVLTTAGWLSRQPEAFQAEVLARSHLLRFAPGDIVFRHGDPLGGVYGLVAGSVLASTAPPQEAPRLVHVGRPGMWVGEGCFLSREPRRVGLRASSEAWMLHLPLAAMDQMAARDPLPVMRRFVQILLINLDILVQVFHDLQSLDQDRRIAAALLRVAGAEGGRIGISQEDLGVMTGASRKKANAVLRRFAAEGWVALGYRAVTVADPAALRRFVNDPRD